MPSPQGEPKVPDAADWPWPTHTIARVHVKMKNAPAVPGNHFYSIRHSGVPSGCEEETYVPVAALLSDEVKEAVEEALRQKTELIDAAGERIEDHSYIADIAIQAAIHQLEGGERG